MKSKYRLQFNQVNLIKYKLLKKNYLKLKNHKRLQNRQEPKLKQLKNKNKIYKLLQQTFKKSKTLLKNNNQKRIIKILKFIPKTKYKMLILCKMLEIKDRKLIKKKYKLIKKKIIIIINQYKNMKIHKINKIQSNYYLN